jgi:hypothetical protein
MNLSYEKILLQRLKEGYEYAFSLIFPTYYKDLVLFATQYIHSVNGWYIGNE